jgi:hypothetical protein
MAVKNNFQRQLADVKLVFSRIKAWRLKGAILVAALGVIALGILAASRPAAPVETTAAMEPIPEEEVVQTAAPAPRKTPRARKNATARPAAGAPVEARKPAPAAAPAPAVAAAVEGDESAMVTLTGCLEQDDDVFRLKDTEGANAPKKRSWKSGFLKKSTPKIDVVDANNRLRLQNHVGHRISVTGLLYEKELLANSVKRVANSCEE